MTKFSFIAALFVLVSVASIAQCSRIVLVNRQPMMALDTFGQTFDAGITYNDARDGLSISLGAHTVDFVPYARRAWIDGRMVALDTPVEVIDGVTYVPVCFLCNSFGYDYDSADLDHQVVVINRITDERVIFVTDDAWCRRPHYWDRQVDCHVYLNFRIGAQHSVRDRWAGQPQPVRDNYRPAPLRDRSQQQAYRNPDTRTLGTGPGGRWKSQGNRHQRRQPSGNRKHTKRH